MLHAESIRKHFPTRGGNLVVLRDVHLSLSAGSSAAIMGPSGCGKSTLLNILGTLEPPSGGSLVLDGCDPFALAQAELARFRNRNIGFIFQDHHLLPQCSALENVLIPTLAGHRENSAEDRAVDLLARVGLSDRSDHRPAELSGGERQRVAIARALINRPKLVLADEPTGNLDRGTASEVADLLVEVHRESRRENHKASSILIVVTHSESLARRIDACWDLVDGTLVRRD